MLQEALAFPAGLELTRGFIKELRIHVPWTALTSRPVEVTLTGVEIVVSRVGVHHPAAARRTVALAAADTSQPELSAQEAEELRRAASADADADETWFQSLITRIAANVSVKLNHFSVRYVQVCVRKKNSPSSVWFRDDPSRAVSQ